MQVYKIGALLRRARIEKKLSIVDMCEGICTKQMASLIEKEQRVAHWKMIESLFSRIGEKTPFDIMAMTKDDVNRYILETQIRKKLSLGSAEIKELLEEYKIKKMIKLEHQFYRFYSAIYENRSFNKNDWALNEFAEALKLTIPNYDAKESFPQQKLLSSTELVILNNISRYQYMNGMKKEGISLMQKLYEYTFNEWISLRERVPSRIMILYNLINWLDDEPALWEKAIQMIEEGLLLCLRYNRFAYYPYFLYEKGYYLAKTGNEKQGKEILSGAIGLIGMVQPKEQLALIIEKIKQDFGFELS